AHRLAPLFRRAPVPVRLRSRQPGKHFTVAVAENELRETAEFQQPRKRLAGQRSRKHIAANHDTVHLRKLSVPENGFESREIAVDVVKGSDAHQSLFSSDSIISWLESSHLFQSGLNDLNDVQRPPGGVLLVEGHGS